MHSDHDAASARLQAASACAFLHGTAFAESFREGGQSTLRRAFNTAMAAPCAMMPDADICQSDKHREQICADWFLRRGPCNDALVEYRTQNRQLCAATRGIATDYPEIETVRSGAPSDSAQEAPPAPPTISAIRRGLDEMQLRCASANLPLFQSMHAQARREHPGDVREAEAALDRAFAATMHPFCEIVRSHPDPTVAAAYPMCADRRSQAAACARWFMDARCEDPDGPHRALCLAATNSVE
jgi:hypothetical protein